MKTPKVIIVLSYAANVRISAAYSQATATPHTSTPDPTGVGAIGSHPTATMYQLRSHRSASHRRCLGYDRQCRHCPTIPIHQCRRGRIHCPGSHPRSTFVYDNSRSCPSIFRSSMLLSSVDRGQINSSDNSFFLGKLSGPSSLYRSCYKNTCHRVPTLCPSLHPPHLFRGDKTARPNLPHHFTSPRFDTLAKGPTSPPCSSPLFRGRNPSNYTPLSGGL